MIDEGLIALAFDCKDHWPQLGALAAFGAWFWKAMSRKLTIHGG